MLNSVILEELQNIKCRLVNKYLNECPISQKALKLSCSLASRAYRQRNKNKETIANERRSNYSISRINIILGDNESTKNGLLR